MKASLKLYQGAQCYELYKVLRLFQTAVFTTLAFKLLCPRIKYFGTLLLVRTQKQPLHSWAIHWEYALWICDFKMLCYWMSIRCPFSNLNKEGLGNEPDLWFGGISWAPSQSPLCLVVFKRGLSLYWTFSSQDVPSTPSTSSKLDFQCFGSLEVEGVSCRCIERGGGGESGRAVGKQSFSWVLGDLGSMTRTTDHRACLPAPKGRPFVPPPLSAIDQLWASLGAGMTSPDRMASIS